MRTTKVFRSGNSQAVRLPKDFQFNCENVEILRRNKEVIIREISENLSSAFALLTQLPDDFFPEKREDTLPQERDSFE